MANKYSVDKSNNDSKNKLNRFFQSITRDLWVILLDIVAVNASYYLALLIRFYVNSEFRPTVSYLLGDWASFAPWYTVICITVFILWRLYGGMWRYAGINDMNRIIGANACTCVAQVVGTLIFVRRMPITYYAIGAVLQFLMISAIRFSYRIFLVEKKKLARTERIPALVIGSGELGRKVVNHLEDSGSYRPVAIVGSDAGRMLNGTPVIAFSSLASAIDEKKVKAVFIADPLLTADKRKEMQRIVEDEEITVQDYTGYQANTSGRIPLTTLLSLTHGAVTIVVDDEKKTYANPEAVLKDITEKMDVKEISTPEITIQKAVDTGWNAWVENYTATTGQDISNL